MSDPPQGDTHITVPSIVVTGSLRLHHLINSSWAAGSSAFIFNHTEYGQNWRTVCVIICLLSKGDTVTLSKSLLVNINLVMEALHPLYYFPNRTLIPIWNQYTKKN